MKTSVRLGFLALATVVALVWSASSATAFSRVLKSGTSGTDVKCWQLSYNASNSWMHYGNAVTVDGKFGADTRYATMAFQRIYGEGGLVVDGMVGPRSSDAMRDALMDVEAYGTTAQDNAARAAFDYCGQMLWPH